ncbi:MAG: prefoldin subunit [Candidatus Pacearchaeota archaeon]
MEQKDRDQKIQEMQTAEQNLQNILYQKQAFQMEISETKEAISEMETSEEVFKIVGQLMMKTDKEKAKEELLNKEKVLNTRINSLEEQEKGISERLEELREEVS